MTSVADSLSSTTSGAANGVRSGSRGASLTRLVDDELSEIIDTQDYNENCRFVGDYTEQPAAPSTATAAVAGT